MNKIDLKNKYVIVAIVAVVILSFYGGVKYGSKNKQVSLGQSNFASRGGMGMRNGPGGVMGGSFVSGEIIGKDQNSITIKLRDGGSKIIFLSSSTEISKFVSGLPADLESGKTVTISGKQNPDGSVTAETIQLRPQAITPVKL